jgi:hypothetical protein
MTPALLMDFLGYSCSASNGSLRKAVSLLLTRGLAVLHEP